MAGTKNDVAWDKIFSKYNILNQVENNGFFEIKSKQINEFRESRLMTKFDHLINLPTIFQKNSLSILPNSRSTYIIGYFKTHETISYSNQKPIPIESLNYESIDHKNLYSESSSLLYAFNSGIMNDLVGEDVALTLAGRMSSKEFDFEINNSINNELFPINVQNSQIEIDGGFESDSSLMLIEAKNTQADDFLIRQIYYPYRLWENNIDKNIINVFMTYSNDRFSFFLYDFKNKSEYNSLELIKQVDYIIAPESIELSDLKEIFDDVVVCQEPSVPFPQADKFERVVDLLGLLYEYELTRDAITVNYEFDIRQTHYYAIAGKYLGLIDKYKDEINGEITYCLTNVGRSILNEKYNRKYLLLAEKILEHDIFNKIFEKSLDQGEIPDISKIVETMYELNMGDRYKHKVLERRARTIKSWIDWIFKLT